jgi:hypothetical protein
MSNLNVLMSIGTFLLAAQWLMYPGIRKGWSLFLANKFLVAMAVLYIIHLLWVLNSDDLTYALKDLRVKLPLLVFALVVGGAQLSRNQVKYTFLALAVGVWVASGRAYFNYFAHEHHLLKYRDLVEGISHIRLSLLMVVVVAAVAHYWNELSGVLKFMAVLTVLNIVLFFNLIQSASGIIILLLLTVFSVLYFAWQRFGKKGLAMASGFIGLVILALGLWLNAYYQAYFSASADPSALPSQTEAGNPYFHNFSTAQVENGHYTFLYLSEAEMVDAWKLRSEVPMDGEDNNLKRAGLIRYLTSKGLPKDSVGVMSLSAQDVDYIEQGFPSVVYTEKNGLWLRLYTTVLGYHMYKVTGNSAGSSLFQRLVYWRAATALIQKHFWLGTGTGDVKTAFHDIYDQIEVNLEPHYRLRAHNQYLTFWVSFGILGFCVFLMLFILPLFSALQGKLSYLHMAFLLVAFLSCITEDTLETQAGVTFFAFLYALLAVPERSLPKKHPSH